MHLFGGPIDIEAYEEQAAAPPRRSSSNCDELAERVSALEAELAELKRILQD
jgi:uncharacterized protein YceH (UPF0502 family)